MFYYDIAETKEERKIMMKITKPVSVITTFSMIAMIGLNTPLHTVPEVSANEEIPREELIDLDFYNSTVYSEYLNGNNISLTMESQKREDDEVYEATYEEATESFDEVLEIQDSIDTAYEDFAERTYVEPEPTYTYIGAYTLTAYCPCAYCCGHSTGLTANGTVATPNHTVASNSLPLGTTIYIEGYGEYTVEDRGGMSSSVIDIFFGSHGEALGFGKGYADVYIVDYPEESTKTVAK